MRDACVAQQLGEGCSGLQQAGDFMHGRGGGGREQAKVTDIYTKATRSCRTRRVQTAPRSWEGAISESGIGSVASRGTPSAGREQAFAGDEGGRADLAQREHRQVRRKEGSWQGPVSRAFGMPEIQAGVTWLGRVDRGRSLTECASKNDLKRRRGGTRGVSCHQQIR